MSHLKRRYLVEIDEAILDYFICTDSSDDVPLSEHIRAAEQLGNVQLVRHIYLAEEAVQAAPGKGVFEVADNGVLMLLTSNWEPAE